jgi:hypothetical protein
MADDLSTDGACHPSREIGVRRRHGMSRDYACLLALALIVFCLPLQIGSFYGQQQFIERFGTTEGGVKQITAAWQSGLSNSSVIGQVSDLCILIAPLQVNITSVSLSVGRFGRRWLLHGQIRAQANYAGRSRRHDLRHLHPLLCR